MVHRRFTVTHTHTSNAIHLLCYYKQEGNPAQCKKKEVEKHSFHWIVTHSRIWHVWHCYHFLVYSKEKKIIESVNGNWCQIWYNAFIEIKKMLINVETRIFPLILVRIKLLILPKLEGYRKNPSFKYCVTWSLHRTITRTQDYYH